MKRSDDFQTSITYTFTEHHGTCPTSKVNQQKQLQ
ncbi:uncharacterized protein METZ01_LOCUS209758 [marine metagenome]|uniref:Uncharacterized protein n=1 Tax=marine metagenome TaxID=408172 RepID=A0A382F3H6_9ZZZZ